MINLTAFNNFKCLNLLIKQLEKINVLYEMVNLPSETINIDTKW